MIPKLNREYLSQVPSTIIKPVEISYMPSAVLHFGIGGFHRSHQAFYFQQLRDKYPERFSSWSIVGACILPEDKSFVEKMKQQDFLYTLKSSSSEGKEDVRIISSIANIYFGPTESEEIIATIASEETKIVSFTITEGGYMIDEGTGRFKLEHPDIVADLKGEEVPKTVFGYLARGLEKRKQNRAEKITFLSCDNVQENGQVLKQALLAFVQAFDQDLAKYVLEHVNFPNSMVDRITPITTARDRDDFEQEYGYRDECLVISEDFCQWIVEETGDPDFPWLHEVGVTIVNDVRPYEKMKLHILNGGHSLVGLIGKAMGYEYIHTAVKDEQISLLFDRYINQEAIPSLANIKDQSFNEYMTKVKNRFGNELIQDSTDRIISFSSAKIPKFILPVMNHSIETDRSFLISSLIIAAWWHYLNEHIDNKSSTDVIDSMKFHWEQVFNVPKRNSVVAFLETEEVFGEMGIDTRVQEQVKKMATIIESNGMVQTLKIVNYSQN